MVGEIKLNHLHQLIDQTQIGAFLTWPQNLHGGRFRLEWKRHIFGCGSEIVEYYCGKSIKDAVRLVSIAQNERLSGSQNWDFISIAVITAFYEIVCGLFVHEQLPQLLLFPIPF